MHPVFCLATLQGVISPPTLKSFIHLRPPKAPWYDVNVQIIRVRRTKCRGRRRWTIPRTHVRVLEG